MALSSMHDRDINSMPPILLTPHMGAGKYDNMQLKAIDLVVHLEIRGMSMSPTSFCVAFCLHEKLFFIPWG